MIVASTLSRRELLKHLGIAGAAAFALPELGRVLLFQREVLAREQAQGSGVGQVRTLNAAELATLTAVCARIIPTDENGPGATEARASQYIDRALGGWLAPSRDAYTAGLAAIDDASTKRSGRPIRRTCPPAIRMRCSPAFRRPRFSRSSGPTRFKARSAIRPMAETQISPAGI